MPPKSINNYDKSKNQINDALKDLGRPSGKKSGQSLTVSLSPPGPMNLPEIRARQKSNLITRIFDSDLYATGILGLAMAGVLYFAYPRIGEVEAKIEAPKAKNIVQVQPKLEEKVSTPKIPAISYEKPAIEKKKATPIKKQEIEEEYEEINYDEGPQFPGRFHYRGYVIGKNGTFVLAGSESLSILKEGSKVYEGGEYTISKADRDYIYLTDRDGNTEKYLMSSRVPGKKGSASQAVTMPNFPLIMPNR